MSRVLYFDGVCNLCNGFVNYCLDHDKEGKISYSSLQSEYACLTLPKALLDKIELSGTSATVVYVRNGSVFLRSRAVFELARELDGVLPRFIRIFSILPVWLTDAIYTIVARNRYRIFGKSETCRLPQPQWKGRFLELEVDKVLP